MSVAILQPDVTRRNHALPAGPPPPLPTTAWINEAAGPEPLTRQPRPPSDVIHNQSLSDLT